MSDTRLKSDGSYKDTTRERTIRADAVKETFAASGMVLTTSGRYADANRVQHAVPAPRVA